MQLKKIVDNSWVRIIIISILVGGLLAISGAFFTYRLGIIVRLLYWISTIFLGNVIAVGISFSLDRLRFLEEKPLLYHLLHLAFVSLLITIMVVGVNAIFLDYSFGHDALLTMFPTVLVISVFMTIIHLVISQIPMQSHASKIETPPKSMVLLFERLPFKFKTSKILAINAEDHYLRIHTNIGDTLVLMRLYDAIKELEGIEGSQTHRSWWVAKDAVEDVIKTQGRTNFRLANGVIAPVSRSYINALKAQNWL